MDSARNLEINGSYRSQRGSQNSSHGEFVESGGSMATPTTPFLRSFVNYGSAEISELLATSEDHTRTGIPRIYILSMVSLFCPICVYRPIRVWDVPFAYGISHTRHSMGQDDAPYVYGRPI